MTSGMAAFVASCGVPPESQDTPGVAASSASSTPTVRGSSEPTLQLHSPFDRPSTASGSAERVTTPSRTFSVIAGGDVLNEALVNASGAAAARDGRRYDFEPVFAPVAPIISGADLALCHAELPIGRPLQRPGVYGRSPFGGNLLLAPYEVAAGLAATGFDRCSTASNHSFDLGGEGIVSTLEALESAGMSHVGTARSPTEAATSVMTVNGVRVAHLSYTRGSNTVWPRDPWVLARASSARQVAGDVTAVRAAGAEVVVVSLHIGTEMLAAPTAVDRAFATEITALSRIDLVVHHGPHVVQPVEMVNGTVVYWSVGNFVSGMGVPGTGRYEDPRSLDGLLAAVRFTESSPGRFTAHSTPVLICNERRQRIVHAPLVELADPATTASMTASLQAELRACIARNPAFAQR